MALAAITFFAYLFLYYELLLVVHHFHILIGVKLLPEVRINSFTSQIKTPILPSYMAAM